MRDVSLLIELADGTRRIDCPEESGRFVYAGVEPAFMLKLRLRSADEREAGRVGSGCMDCRLDARDGDRRTLGTLVGTTGPMSEY